MTSYERGYAAGLKAAAEVCTKYSDASPKNMADICHDEILSLPIQGEADQRGAAASQPCHGVPFEGPSAGTTGTQSVPHPNLPDYPQMIADRLKGIYGELTQAATNPGEQVPDSARIGKSPPTTPARSGPCVGVPLPDFDSLADIAAAREEHDAHR